MRFMANTISSSSSSSPFLPRLKLGKPLPSELLFGASLRLMDGLLCAALRTLLEVREVFAEATLGARPEVLGWLLAIAPTRSNALQCDNPMDQLKSLEAAYDHCSSIYESY